MTAGTDIIKGALRKIGAHSIAAPAASETIVEGRDALNSMLQEWETRNIFLGVAPLDAPGDELGEPNDATNAIINNLALELSPFFDNGNNIVSPMLIRAAKTSFNVIYNAYIDQPIPDKVVSSTLPKGAGNKWGHTFGRTFFRKGESING